MSDLREQLKELDERATPGPWFDDDGKIGAEESGIGEMDLDHDASLIITLRNALPEILAALASRDEIRREALREAADVCREMTRYGCVGPEGDYAAGMEVGAGDYIDAESTADAILALAEKEGA